MRTAEPEPPKEEGSERHQEKYVLTTVSFFLLMLALCELSAINGQGRILAYSAVPIS